METGLYRTMDEGENWEKAEMKGFDSTSIGNIAVHPSKKEMLAISSKDGVYVSKDGGDSFTKVENSQTVTSIYLTERVGLFSSIEEGKVQLYEWEFNSNKVQPYLTPKLSQDNPIMYISSNPESSDECTVVTYNNDIYQTTNNGETWDEVVDEGKIAK